MDADANTPYFPEAIISWKLKLMLGEHTLKPPEIYDLSKENYINLNIIMDEQAIQVITTYVLLYKSKQHRAKADPTDIMLAWYSTELPEPCTDNTIACSGWEQTREMNIPSAKTLQPKMSSTHILCFPCESIQTESILVDLKFILSLWKTSHTILIFLMSILK